MSRFFNAVRPFNLYNSSAISASMRSNAIRTPMVAFVRHSGGRPEKSDIEKRALELLQGFEKIDNSKLTLDAHFSKDLGLDSLDSVEVLMALEDEFLMEIPDVEADNMHTVRDAINYLHANWKV